MGDDLARIRGLAESLSLLESGQMHPDGPASVGREILKLLDGLSSSQPLTDEERDAQGGDAVAFEDHLEETLAERDRLAEALRKIERGHDLEHAAAIAREALGLCWPLTELSGGWVAEQEREWTIAVDPGTGAICGSGKPDAEMVVVVPKRDVTDNYMVAVSRLKAERDEFKAQLDEAREALKKIAKSLDEFHGGARCVGIARKALARPSPPSEGK